MTDWMLIYFDVFPQTPLILVLDRRVGLPSAYFLFKIQTRFIEELSGSS
jgi:hypothetical protein